MATQGGSSSARAMQAAATQWQIFNKLDYQEEAEMLELARFLDSLISEFSQKNRKNSIKALESDEDEGGVRSDIQAAIAAAAAEDLEASLPPPPTAGARINPPKTTASVRISHFEEETLPTDVDLMNYGPLPKGPLAPQTAINIIEVYRRGGKLAAKSVKKILRDVYKKLKTVGNTIRVPIVGQREVVHVIGDLHGQLTDLLHILSDAGFPSKDNKFIFNGDYVDRGKHSIEIVMILFSMYLAWPDSVFLNRGNHEDHAICCQPPPPSGCGGFQREVKEKYDDLIFSMVVEVFRYLPLFHILDNQVMIIHGGLFYQPGVTLKDLDDIDRLDYCAAPEPEPAPTTPEEERGQYLRQLMRDALWSDPKPQMGCTFNMTRRQGQLFGPDVTAEFLQTNNLKMLVRSHECVKFGFDQPYEDAPELLATIFSASGYSGSNNLGAYMSYSRLKTPNCFQVGARSLDEGAAMPETPEHKHLFFTVQDYTFTEAGETLEETNSKSLRALVIRQKQNLLDEFVKLDEADSGKISVEQWADVMGRVTGVIFNWQEIVPLLGVKDLVSDGTIDYRQFTMNLRSNMQSLSASEDTETFFNAMYANRNVLEVVFNFFDTNGDGIISREEFQQGCEILNQRLPESKKISNPDSILRIMDMDGNDGIDINEFLETFRIVDAMDGKADGQIDIVSDE